MHVRMRVRDAREKHGERGKLYRGASNVHLADSNDDRGLCNVMASRFRDRPLGFATIAGACRCSSGAAQSRYSNGLRSSGVD
jgi:hypothetical protein